MDFATPSDPLLLLALYSGLAVCLITVGLIVAILALRQTLDRERRRELRLIDRWQPVFFHAIEDIPCTRGRLRRRDEEVVLRLWVDACESVRGTARDRLRQLAQEIGLDQAALRLLKRRGIRVRLLAIVALGRIETAGAAEALRPQVAEANPMLSLLAARSLLQRDPDAGLPLLLQEVQRRDDWPMARIVAMLEDIDSTRLSAALLAALAEAPPAALPRLLGLIGVAHLGDPWPVIAPFLTPEQPGDVLAAALKACHDPRGIEAVRLLAVHAQWVVRAQAAQTLGRIGSAEDRFRLQAMLSDPEWWVRYRAATALAHFPGMSRERLLALCQRLDDGFAADILTQVLAEMHLAPEAA